jgi:AAA15 family ATPase/GTPase
MVRDKYSTVCTKDDSFMVNVKRIYIDGYRNVKKTMLKLARPDQPITLLLAPNNYGKSNTIGAIEFAANLVRLSGEDQRIMIRKNGYASHNKFDNKKNFAFEIEFSHNSTKIEYGFCISQAHGVESEWVKVEDTELFCRAELDERSISSDRLRDDIIIKGDSPFSVLTHNLLVSIDFVGYDNNPGVSDVKKYNEIIRNLFFDIHSNMNCDTKHLIVKHTESLSNDIELDNIMVDFYRYSKVKYRLFKKTFLSLFPDIKNFRLEPQHFGPKHDKKSNAIPDFYRLEFDYKTKKTGKFYQLSDGTRGVFLLLLTVFTRHGCHLLCIEEIEDGIHPSLYRGVLNTLSRLCFYEELGQDTTKIIITTHSPSMTRHFDKRKSDGSVEDEYYYSLYIGDPNNKGYARFLPLKRNMQKNIREEADSYSISIGELVFDMLSSTEDTIKTLKGWLDSNV